MSIEALEKAVAIAGGQTALAKLIGRDQGTIWAWLNTTKRVPAEEVLPIEKATNGQITRYQLRPDLYPKEQ